MLVPAEVLGDAARGQHNALGADVAAPPSEFPEIMRDLRETSGRLAMGSSASERMSPNTTAS